MCGRFAQTATPEALQKQYQTKNTASFEPNYNIPPQSEIPVVLHSRKSDQREIHLLNWGLIPHWNKNSNPKILINARMETISEKPAFRDSFSTRRCIIPAAGFYEWHQKNREPYFIKPKEGLFSFAGIWDRWRTPSGNLRITCSIVTTDAHSTLADIHHRVPVALNKDSLDLWLKTDTTAETAKMLLQTLNVNEIEIYPVNIRINSAKNNDPMLMEPFNHFAEAGNSFR